MKDPLERTKVVLRHLPPSLTEGDLMEQIDAKFAGRYKWCCFRLGKNSQKNQRFARAYIDFRSPEDVFEFAEIFDGHVFVNEKGTRYKVLVEYAPSQHVPKQWTKKDGREGTILKDPEYMEFLELLAKPAENLPSAEIQLERREADKAGAAKEVHIVTPLMDFVRQKRAAKSGSQRTSGNGKPSRRAIISGNSSSSSSKRGLERRRGSTIMYVSKEITKNESGKEKPMYILASRRDERLSDKTADHPSASGKDDNLVEKGTIMNGTVSGVSVSVEKGKKTLLLLKGKDLEGPQIHRLEAPGRIIRSILSSKEGRHMSTLQSDPQFTGVAEKDKHPRRPPVPRPNLKEHHADLLTTSGADGKSHIETKATSNESQHAFVSITDKHEKRLRNKDRPDRAVWATLHHSDGSHGRNNNTISTSEMPLGHGDIKHDMPSGNRSLKSKSLGGGRGSHSSLDNGAHRQAGRRETAHNLKEVDVSSIAMEGKPLKRGYTGYGPHERQLWVQKSGSGS